MHIHASDMIGEVGKGLGFVFEGLSDTDRNVSKLSILFYLLADDNSFVLHKSNE